MGAKANQRQALTAACEARGWRIVEEFVDNGVSGCSFGRVRSFFLVKGSFLRRRTVAVWR